MSILLNALKKSEAQRQLGQTPGIHTPVELPAAETVSEQQWIPLLLLALSAVAITWFIWQQYREPLTLSEIPELVGVEKSEEVVQETTQAVKNPLSESLSRTLVESYKSDRNVSTEADNVTPGTRAKTEQNRQLLNKSFTAFESGKEKSGDEKSQIVSSDQDQPGQDNDQADTVRRPVAQNQAEGDSRKRRTSRVEPHEGTPISFWQLPQALRDGLPEIKITVLVYSEAVEERFVLINGLRLKEKDELSAGVLLDEIRRDGVVFRYKSYRFLLKG